MVLLIATIILSFVIASSLNVYPLSPSMATIRPMVMIMVLIFGCYFSRAYVGVFAAFTIGFIADFNYGYPFGTASLFAAVAVAFS